MNLHRFYKIEFMLQAGNSIYPDGKMPVVFTLNLNLRVENIWNGLGCNLKAVNLLDNKWGDIRGTSKSSSPEFPQERRRIILGIDWKF